MPRQVGLSDSMLLKVGEDSAAADKLCAAVFEIACGAHAHMSHADELASQLPAEANAAFLPAVRLLTRMILHRGGGAHGFVVICAGARTAIPGGTRAGEF